MTAVRHMRASDEDRQRVVALLRDSHAVGRLPPGEFYERLDHAYAAGTWGELDDLTADLPLAWADADLPSGSAAPPGRSQAVRQHLLWRAILACALVLVLGLLSHVTSVALWTGCLLVLVILLLPFVPGCGRTGLRSGRRVRAAHNRDLRQRRLSRCRWCRSITVRAGRSRSGRTDRVSRLL